jgi:hypothetical protein
MLGCRVFRTSRYVLLVVALAACSGDRQPRPVAEGRTEKAGSAAATSSNVERMQLFSDVEVASLRDGLVKRLDANAKLMCSGPKVTAKTRPGPAGDAIVQLFEGTGELAGCIARLSALPEGKALQLAIARRDPALVKLDRECGASIANKVLEAAAHVEGCSPYQTGVRAEPPLDRIIQVALFLDLHAAQLVAVGKRVEAVRIAIAALRVFQDLMRGHVAHRGLGAIAAGASQLTATNLDRLLTTTKLDKAQYEALAGQLDALIAAMPSWAGLMAGERDQMDIYFGAPLMPKNWTPPGGWIDDLRSLADESDPKAAETAGAVPPPQRSAALLSATADYTAAVFETCAVDASYFVCHGAVAAANASATERDEVSYLEELEAFRKAAAANASNIDALRSRVRASLIKKVKPTVRAKKADVASFAVVVARLAALRLHVEVKRTSKCPTAAELASSPYAALAAPAALGDSLELQHTGRSIEARPPAWTNSNRVWTLDCSP